MNEVNNQKSAKVQELEAIANTCREPVAAKRKEIRAKFEEVVAGIIAKSGVEGLGVRVANSGESAEVIWKEHDSERFEITYREEWCENRERKLKVGIGSYWNFDMAERGQVALHAALGFICLHMAEVADQFKSLDWEGLQAAERVYQSACNALDEQERIERAAADKAKRDEAEAKLSGAAGKYLKYGRCGSNQYYLIEKVTPKCVFVKWERNDKEQIIREIVSGKCEVVSAEEAEAARAEGKYVRG